MKVLVLCGNQLRHRFFAAQVAKEFPDSGIIIEEFSEDYLKNYKQENPSLSMKNHFEKFQEEESRFFAESVEGEKSFFESKLIFSFLELSFCC